MVSRVAGLGLGDMSNPNPNPNPRSDHWLEPLCQPVCMVPRVTDVS